MSSMSSAGNAACSSLDHKAAVLDLYSRGFHPSDIRQRLLSLGYFPGRNWQSVTALIYATIHQSTRKKAVQSSHRENAEDIERMLALAGKREGFRVSRYDVDRRKSPSGEELPNHEW